MTIKHINIATAQFTDVNGVGRFLYGCPLVDRPLLSDALRQVQSIVSEYDSFSIQELLLDDDFYQWADLAASLCGLELNWLVSEEAELIFQSMVLYEKDGVFFRGDLEALEFSYRYAQLTPSQSPLDPPQQTKFFDELWFQGCQRLHKLKDLDLYDCVRFKELSEFLLPLMCDRSLEELWDTEPMVQEVITEQLEIFGLTSKDVSAAMATKLLIAEDCLPGHLHQLLASKPDKSGESLPKDETVLGASIAGMMGEYYPLDSAMGSIRGVPQKLLSSIIKSRNRMIKEAMAKVDGKGTGLTEEQAEFHRQNISKSFGLLAKPDALRAAAGNKKPPTL